MNDISFPRLPFIKREKKPREKGINYVRAPVTVGTCIDDYLEAYGSLVDIFKISAKQGAQMSKKSLLRFIKTCKNYEVKIALGNPVMDVALSAGKEIVDDFLDTVVGLGIDIVEVSSVSRSLDDDDMCRLIENASKKGIKIINEIGVAFAHSEVTDEEIFIERVKMQSQRFINAGSWKILLESEGLTENIDKKDYRWNIIDKIISPLDLNQFMVESDDQDVLSKYIEIYGPGINMMVDYNRLLKMEDARIGYGPSQFLWGKVVKY